VFVIQFSKSCYLSSFSLVSGSPQKGQNLIGWAISVLGL